jgi:hypothetical protein
LLVGLLRGSAMAAFPSWTSPVRIRSPALKAETRYVSRFGLLLWFESGGPSGALKTVTAPRTAPRRHGLLTLDSGPWIVLRYRLSAGLPGQCCPQVGP